MPPMPHPRPTVSPAVPMPAPRAAQPDAPAERTLDVPALAAVNRAAAELAARRRAAQLTEPTEVWSNSMAVAVAQLHGGVRETLQAAHPVNSTKDRIVRGLLVARPHP